MRSLGFLFLSLAVSLLVVECTSPSRETKTKMDEAKKKIGDAVDATAEAAKAKRDDFVKEMNTRLEELDAKYEDLKGRAAKGDEQAKKRTCRRSSMKPWSNATWRPSGWTNSKRRATTAGRTSRTVWESPSIT